MKNSIKYLLMFTFGVFVAIFMTSFWWGLWIGFILGAGILFGGSGSRA